MVLKKLKQRFSSKKKQSINFNRTASPTTVIANEDVEKPAEIVIVGAGIVGLVLALALQKHLGIKPEIYEQARAFHDDVGAGMGMYPNGLRVIRDIDPKLLEKVSDAGYPYMFRRWEVRRRLQHPGRGIIVPFISFLTNAIEILIKL